MTVVPPNLEKGTANVIRARTGSVIGTVAEKRRGTGIRIVKEVTGTESVIGTTGTVVSAAREGNTVIVLMIVTVTVTVMIETVTGAMILRGEEIVTEMAIVGIVPAPPRVVTVTVTADLDLAHALDRRASA